MDLPDFLTRGPLDEIRFSGHRIDLYHFVYYYNEGYSAEMLLCQFPTLKLSLIHKVIAFYLDNRAEVDAYTAEVHAQIEEQRSAGQHVPSLAELRRRLEARQRAEHLRAGQV
jgi:uncharacterized protein (DUF433 family)